MAFLSVVALPFRRVRSIRRHSLWQFQTHSSFRWKGDPVFHHDSLETTFVHAVLLLQLDHVRMPMSFKQIDRVRCDECETEAEIPSSSAPPEGDLMWCCRVCGAPLTSLDDQRAELTWAASSAVGKAELH
jgi:hypothetical protein